MAGVLVGMSGFLIWDQHYWWQLQDEYAFGYIVPLFVAYILYERWPEMRRRMLGSADGAVAECASEVERGPFSACRLLGPVLGLLAGLMVTGGMASFLLGSLYRSIEGQNLISSNLLAFGFANVLLGGAYLYTDRRWDGSRLFPRERFGLAMLFLFPALIWMLSVPMFSAVQHVISTFLMNQVAVVVYHTFDLLGYAVIREGSVLKLPLGDVGVEDACSGIRSLTACLFAGSFLGAVYFSVLWKKVFLVLTAMLFAFLNNILRSLFLTAWAYGKGPEGLDSHVHLLGMDLGNVHDFTGWVVLGITVVCLLVLVKIFSIQIEYQLPETESAS